MQNRMLGRAGFPAAPATRGPQAGQAHAAPVIFRKDRLDTCVCSIALVPCTALSWTPTDHDSLSRSLFQPLGGSVKRIPAFAGMTSPPRRRGLAMVLPHHGGAIAKGCALDAATQTTRSSGVIGIATPDGSGILIACHTPHDTEIRRFGKPTLEDAARMPTSHSWPWVDRRHRISPRILILEQHTKGAKRLCNSIATPDGGAATPGRGRRRQTSPGPLLESELRSVEAEQRPRKDEYPIRHSDLPGIAADHAKRTQFPGGGILRYSGILLFHPSKPRPIVRNKPNWVRCE